MAVIFIFFTFLISLMHFRLVPKRVPKLHFTFYLIGLYINIISVNAFKFLQYMIQKEYDWNLHNFSNYLA